MTRHLPDNPDWRRKHVGDLAYVCQKFGDDQLLPVEHRRKFADVYAIIKPISRLPAGGDGQPVTEAVTAVCKVCRAAFDHACQGRYDWRLPCDLVHKVA